ncbi:hypothetical protein [Agrobacterium bohemicum]|uniref:Uncharacterized protein n=1 Tax=Agrobacterium bohemicum TaxID=2052828 RepID=A0A135P0Z5_9HYPH|nr:hypothetical protein [Agrobacterium bohemicum]KXG85085.1 hypothetical protein ATO67_10740 [Agrobacterium bohemicum]
MNDFLSFDGDELIDGYSKNTVSYRPLDLSKANEKALKAIYDLFVNYFSNNGVGFKKSAFYGYDMHGVLGAWHYCYAINFIEKYDPEQAAACDEVNKNFFWQPPLIHYDVVKEYFKAPFEEGENPALWSYGLLKESMRRNGEKPKALAGMSLDDLIKAADAISELRGYVQLGNRTTSYASTAAGILAILAAKKALGVAGVIWGQTDNLLGIIEKALEEEILHRIDAKPNDDLDVVYFRSRAQMLGLKSLKLELGAR